MPPPCSTPSGGMPPSRTTRIKLRMWMLCPSSTLPASISTLTSSPRGSMGPFWRKWKWCLIGKRGSSNLSGFIKMNLSWSHIIKTSSRISRFLWTLSSKKLKSSKSWANVNFGWRKNYWKLTPNLQNWRHTKSICWVSSMTPPQTTMMFWILIEKNKLCYAICKIKYKCSSNNLGTVRKGTQGK